MITAEKREFASDHIIEYYPTKYSPFSNRFNLDVLDPVFDDNGLFLRRHRVNILSNVTRLSAKRRYNLLVTRRNNWDKSTIGEYKTL
jgi:hypothetical protein